MSDQPLKCLCTAKVWCDEYHAHTRERGCFVFELSAEPGCEDCAGTGTVTGTDPVSHPAHYTFAPGYEVKDVIRAWGLGFTRGNVVKYVARAGRKGVEGDELEDLRKARFYLDDEITALEREKKVNNE